MELLTAIADIAAIIHHEILLFALFGLVVGGLDDLLIDLLFLVHTARRKLFIYTRHTRMTGASLPPSHAPGTIAIFIPAWDESSVIGPMLRNCLNTWQKGAFRIFIGTYPNDPATIEIVTRIASADGRVHPVILPHPGKTTKADCLNHIYQAMLREERVSGTRFKAVVLHDAEDVVHADEIRLFDCMMDRFDMVQLPVRPLLTPRSLWIAGHYADEFAEAHGKHLVIREALGAAVPSAGVGCGIRRDILAGIADARGGMAFDHHSLTEDYELGLRIAERGGKTIFVAMDDAQGGLICTQEHFPETLEDALKQKARWFAGIALSGWDRMGWSGSWRERWMRLHDRRGSLAALVLFAAYLATFGQILLWIASAAGLTVQARPSATVEAALLLTAFLMGWRLAFRFFWSTHAYGWRQGLCAIPRTIVANMIAMLAARRAVGIYLRQLAGGNVVWDKTRHRFPQQLRADPPMPQARADKSYTQNAA